MATTPLNEPNDLQAIRALRPDGPRRLAERVPARMADKLAGAWLGRAAGCTLGVPVENWAIADMQALAKRAGVPFPPDDYWPEHPEPDELRYATSRTRDYLRGAITCVPVDDDLTYTLLGLLILEEYGPAFTVDDVGAAWMKYLPEACTAEAVALENLRRGIPAREAAVIDNPYLELIGADIRSDPWGYAAAGWPQMAAELAWRDAYLSHRTTGIYGAMYFAAAIAAAFVVEDALAALRLGLTEIPQSCRFADAVRWALDIAPTLDDWRTARRIVDARYPGMDPVHTINNACLTVFGLHLGGGDFTRTIGLTVAMGLDNDCTAATAGSILGAVQGVQGIPEHWRLPFGDKTRTYLIGREWFSNADIVNRFLNQAESVHDQQH